MEAGEDVLQEGIAELTLDRPPSCLLHDGHGALAHSPPRFGRKTSRSEERFPHGPLPLDPSALHSDIGSELKVIPVPCTCKESVEMGNEKRDYLDGAVGTLPVLMPVDDSSRVDGIRPEISERLSTLSSTSTVQTQPGRLRTIVPILRKETSGKPKRRVVFPEEKQCVTELIDPVDPWLNVPVANKREVIFMYKNTCQKLRIRACDKLVKQIQNSSDLSPRISSLTLRGTKLDARACEALESVFQRVQFDSLDIENCGLEEEGATSILEMVEFYHSACKLNIACNPRIGIRGWQALCRMLKKTPCLMYLDARRTLLTDQTMPTFGRCLKADPPLRILHLEGVYLSGRPLLILTTAMKYNTILEELYLGDNDLNSNDGPPIGAMLSNNLTLSLLDLRNNLLNDMGVGHIGAGLADQAAHGAGGLASLILWNNGLTHEGMSFLYEGLVRTTSLKALNLGQNRIGDLGMQRLKPGLIKNRSLQKIGFLNTKLGSEGAIALAEVLADSLLLTRIDIRENSIHVAGLMAFSLALKVNRSLLRLDLDKDVRQETGMESVLQTVLVDIYNYCYRNKQLAKEISPVADAPSSSGVVLARIPSTSSETQDLNYLEDLFHPENRLPQVVPYSPVSDAPMPPAPDLFPKLDFNEILKKNPDSDRRAVFSFSNNNPDGVGEGTVDYSSSAASSVLSSRPTSLAIEERSASQSAKGSRFSVTKIFLDSIGDIGKKASSRLVKQASRDKADVSSSARGPPASLSEMTSFAENASSEPSIQEAPASSVHSSLESTSHQLARTVSSFSDSFVEISSVTSDLDLSGGSDCAFPLSTTGTDPHDPEAGAPSPRYDAGISGGVDAPTDIKFSSTPISFERERVTERSCRATEPVVVGENLADEGFRSGPLGLAAVGSKTALHYPSDGEQIVVASVGVSKENIEDGIAGSESFEGYISLSVAQSSPLSSSPHSLHVLCARETAEARDGNLSVQYADIQLSSVSSSDVLDTEPVVGAFSETTVHQRVQLEVHSESCIVRQYQSSLNHAAGDDRSQLPVCHACADDALRPVDSVLDGHVRDDSGCAFSSNSDNDLQVCLNILRSRSDKVHAVWNTTLQENGTTDSDIGVRVTSAEFHLPHAVSVNDAAL